MSYKKLSKRHTFLHELVNRTCAQKITDLRKLVKHKKVFVEPFPDVEMKEAPFKAERIVDYSTYTEEDGRKYFYFLTEKL